MEKPRFLENRYLHKKAAEAGLTFTTKAPAPLAEKPNANRCVSQINFFYISAELYVIFENASCFPIIDKTGG